MLGTEAPHEASLSMQVKQLVLSFLRHNVCQAIASIIGTVAIAVLASNTNSGIWLWITSIFYAGLVVAVALVNHHDAKQSKELAEKNRSLKLKNELVLRLSIGEMTIAASCANLLCKLSKRVGSKKQKVSLEFARDIFGFQKVAIEVCIEIYEMIQMTYGINSQYITIYQRFKNDNGSPDVCKMIAYRNQHREEPITYQNPYDIIRPKDQSQKIEYHTDIFLSNSIDIRVLADANSIKEKFKYHEQNAEREKRICQYIGIPIAINNSNIAFLLQIDVDVPGVFGESVNEVLETAETAFYPFAKLLHMVYEQDRLLETMYNAWYNRQTPQAALKGGGADGSQISAP